MQEIYGSTDCSGSSVRGLSMSARDEYEYGALSWRASGGRVESEWWAWECEVSGEWEVASLSHAHHSLSDSDRLSRTHPSHSYSPLIATPLSHSITLYSWNPIRSVQWSPDGAALRIIDQRRLPAEFVERDLHALDEMRDAITTLAVRGAPAIGVAAAIGLVVSLAPVRATRAAELLRARLGAHAALLAAARPTAVNLPWAMARMTARAGASPAAGRDGAARDRCAPKPPRSSTKTAPCAKRSARTAWRSFPTARACSRTATPARSPPPASARRSRRCTLAHRARAPRARVRERDAAAPAGQPAHRVGTRPGRASRSRSSPTAWPRA